jgi:acyl carrier protein
MDPEHFLRTLSDELGLDVPADWRHLRLKDDLRFDSIWMIEMIMVLEEDLGIWIDEQVIDQLETLADVYECCRALVLEQS